MFEQHWPGIVFTVLTKQYEIVNENQSPQLGE